MDKLACRFIDYLIENRIITKETRLQNIYAMEVLCGRIINYSTFFILSCVNGNIASMLVFISCFLILRSSTGGYHASTWWMCYIDGILMYYVVSKFIIIFLQSNLIALLGTICVSSIFILFWAPINHPNLGLSEREIKACQKYSRLYVFLVLICVAVLVFGKSAPYHYAACVAAGVGVDAFFILLAKVTGQEEAKDEQGKE